MDKRNIKPKNKRGLIVILLALLCSFACITVGFASWVTIGGVNERMNGDVDSEEIIENPNYHPCIDNFTVNSYSFLAKYGFDVDGLYTATTQITGSGDLNVATAVKSIRSLENNRLMNLKFTFVSEAFSTYFKSSGITLSGDLSVSSSGISYNSSVKGFSHSFSFENVIIDSEAVGYKALLHFNFSFNISYTNNSSATIGKNGNFPDFSGNNKIEVSILPGEYA